MSDTSTGPHVRPTRPILLLVEDHGRYTLCLRCIQHRGLTAFVSSIQQNAELDGECRGRSDGIGCETDRYDTRGRTPIEDWLLERAKRSYGEDCVRNLSECEGDVQDPGSWSMELITTWLAARGLAWDAAQWAWLNDS